MSQQDRSDEPALHPTDGGLVRVRIDLAYDGTAYAGWARQPAQRTVQGTVEAALARVLQLPGPPGLTVAGRTDAGVHARGQVAHVDLPAGAPVGELARRLNGVLPADVRLARAGVAPDGFDARFSALSRVYAYRIADQAAGRNPLRRLDTLTHPRALDVAAMRTASAGLLGEHDFGAYCRRREGGGTVRRLISLDWARDQEGVVVATAEADAFCHSMVRSLVGALVAVGEGWRDVGWPAEVLAAGVRDPSVAVPATGARRPRQPAPAHGLTLMAVRYPADEELAARATATRRRRDAAGST